jgi:hypothetical protein
MIDVPPFDSDWNCATSLFLSPTLDDANKDLARQANEACVPTFLIDSVQGAPQKLLADDELLR